MQMTKHLQWRISEFAASPSVLEIAGESSVRIWLRCCLRSKSLFRAHNLLKCDRGSAGVNPKAMYNSRTFFTTFQRSEMKISRHNKSSQRPTAENQQYCKLHCVLTYSANSSVLYVIIQCQISCISNTPTDVSLGYHINIYLFLLFELRHHQYVFLQQGSTLVDT